MSDAGWALSMVAGVLYLFMLRDIVRELDGRWDARHGGDERCRVRVWFGRHVIADYIGDAALARRYEAAMRKRFAGLRITSEGAAPKPARPRCRHHCRASGCGS